MRYLAAVDAGLFAAAFMSVIALSFQNDWRGGFRAGAAKYGWCAAIFFVGAIALAGLLNTK